VVTEGLSLATGHSILYLFSNVNLLTTEYTDHTEKSMLLQIHFRVFCDNLTLLKGQ